MGFCGPAEEICSVESLYWRLAGYSVTHDGLGFIVLVILWIRIEIFKSVGSISLLAVQLSQYCQVSLYLSTTSLFFCFVLRLSI